MPAIIPPFAYLVRETHFSQVDDPANPQVAGLLLEPIIPEGYAFKGHLLAPLPLRVQGLTPAQLNNTQVGEKMQIRLTNV